MNTMNIYNEYINTYASTLIWRAAMITGPWILPGMDFITIMYTELRTVRCRYNTVKFLKQIHKYTP